MANTYIVELYKWVSQEHHYEKKDNCIMALNTETGDLTIKSDDDRKIAYVSVNVIKDDIVIMSRKNYMTRQNQVFNQLEFVECEMRFKGNRFALRFDSRSSAAEKNFSKEFTILRNKHTVTSFYQSGNRKIEGMKTEDGYNGMCIEYYDQVDSPVKYVGEFEDGLYDGEGDFFSMDGNIRLVCKNICSGKPNGFGKLIVGKNKLSKLIEMKQYSQLNSLDDQYLSKIYAKIEPKYNDMIELLNFEKLTLEERLSYLFLELQKMKSDKSEPKQTKSFFNMF